MSTPKPTDNVQVAYQTDQPLPDNAKSAVGGCELPGGYLDPDGVLHTELEIVEMTGAEEDILASKRMQAFQKLQTIMENCITKVGDIRREGNSEWSKLLKDLTATDRLYAMIKIRETTLGSAYTFKSQCPSCGETSEQVVSLSEFVIKPPKDPKLRTWTGVLAKSKKSYTAKVQTGHDESKLAKAAKDNSDMLSLGILARLVELGGQQPVDLKMVKALSLADRNQLRKEFDDHEADIQNQCDVTCPACGSDYKAEISVGDASFFFPSAT